MLAIYLRSSTTNNEDSLPAQEAACRAWADQHGLAIQGVYVDEGVSGALGPDERPGLSAALLAVQEGRAQGLVVHRLDRLARELHVQEAALAHVWHAGGHVYEGAHGEVMRDDPDDPMRRAMRQMMGVFGELERGMITARLRSGRRRKKERGGYLGGPTVPFGQRVQGAGKTARLVPDPDAEPRIRRVLDLRAEGLTYHQIVAQLNAEGVPTARGGRWHLASVQRVLQRAQA